jgi:ethanolamine utilization protein EutN
VGERVLVAQGSVPAAWFPGKAPPIDALIIGSIDEPASGPGVAAGPVTKTVPVRKVRKTGPVRKEGTAHGG